MRRPATLVGSIVALVAVVAGIDYIRVEAKESRVSRSVTECGGNFGSIPAWPLGSEYRITFHRALTSEELDTLAELNTLRGSVGVAFVDCELSQDQARVASTKLHNCALVRVVDGKTAALTDEQE